MIKKIIIFGLKSAFVGASYMALNFGYEVLKPLIIADASMMQLQDSDVSYASFKGVERAFNYYWVLYILPLVVFVTDIKKLYPKGEK